MTASKEACADVDAVSVQRAIDRGVSYLRKTQNARGGWPETMGGDRHGLSSLCTLAMLNAGVPTNDPAIVRALTHLRSFQPTRTYSVSLQTLVLCQVGAVIDRPRILRNVRWLAENQLKASGLWSYGGIGGGDASNTQFALLALGAAVDRDFQVDPAVFQRTLDYWVNAQRTNGGWTYLRSSGDSPSGSMTCAGIASVIIASGRLRSVEGAFTEDDIQCCGQDIGESNSVEMALDFLGRSFSTTVNPGGPSDTYFYYMYALERVGRLTGRRFIGQHDWYREGAESLLDLQDDFEGSWTGFRSKESNSNIATAFSLLFLSKGKRQVVVAKLKYGVPSNSDPRSAATGNQDWNHHPDSLRHLVRHVERDWGRDLTWQTIDASSATVEDLSQVPVIMISGQQSLRMTATQAERLKEYIDQGGTLLFEADGGEGCVDATPFRDSAVRLCNYWFPDTPLQRLPPEHPVWFAERKVDPTALDESFWVYGIQACCRTPIFLVPSSLSCRWELSSTLLSRREMTPSAKRELQAAVSLGENIIAYATGRELKDKLDQPTLLPGKSILTSVRGQFGIGELPVGAGGEDARRALPNVATMISQRVPLAVAATDQLIVFDREVLQEVSMLWIHGRTDFTLTAEQRGLLREFLRNGGFVFANAICGSEEFATAFRRELAIISPEMTLSPLASDAPAFTSQFNGFDVRRVTIRRPIRDGNSLQLHQRESYPVIEVGRTAGLVNVFFSPLDVSCALESQNSVQCPGYATGEAVKIVANLILYALQQEPANETTR